jgi:hypothetical protein
MKQNTRNAIYHFLGATVGLIPLIGIGAPAVYFMFQKFPSAEEENHYRSVLNFLITFFLIGLLLYGFIPKPVASVIWFIWTFMTMGILVYNGVQALKGRTALYPFAIAILKPVKKTQSPEEMMYSNTDPKS